MTAPTEFTARGVSELTNERLEAELCQLAADLAAVGGVHSETALTPMELNHTMTY